MSDDLDLDMEVVEDDELDELGADGASSSEKRTLGETEKEESAGFETNVVETDDAESATTRSESRWEKGERGRTTDSASKANSSQEIFGLGSVPEEWEVSPLPSVVEIEMGSSPPSSTYNEEEQGLPFYQGNADFGRMTPKVSTWCSDPVKTADKNDVLISIRAPVGDLNIADEHCCIGRGLAALRPDKVSGLYLFYGLAQRSRWLSRLASGSTFKSVSSADLEKVDLPVPPLSEQRKIAGVLYAVDQAIQKTEAIIEQATQAQRGLLRELLTEGFNDHETSNAGALGEIPTDWRTEKLGQVADVQRGKFTHRPRNDPDFYDGAYPFIQTGEVVEARGKLTHYSQTLNEKGRGVSKRFDSGTIVITIAGNIGDTAIATFPVYFPDSLVGITAGDEVDPYYLEFFLRSRKKYLNRLATETTQKNLNLSLLRPIDVALPPLSEQRRIAGVLKDLDSKIRSEERYAHQLRRLKKGLMQNLLTGEVRTADKAVEVLDEVKAHG